MKMVPPILALCAVFLLPATAHAVPLDTPAPGAVNVGHRAGDALPLRADFSLVAHSPWRLRADPADSGSPTPTKPGRTPRGTGSAAAAPTTTGPTGVASSQSSVAPRETSDSPVAGPGTQSTTQPSDPPSQPSDPPSQPSDPPSQPSDPPSQPSDPPSQPSDPPSQPSDPPSQPSDPPNSPPASSAGPGNVSAVPARPGVSGRPIQSAGPVATMTSPQDEGVNPGNAATATATANSPGPRGGLPGTGGSGFQPLHGLTLLLAVGAGAALAIKRRRATRAE